METIQNKKTLIVGATGAIGNRTAKMLANSGADLYLSGRDQQKLNDLGKELGLGSDRLFTFSTNDEGAVQNAAQKIGNVDFLINTSGIGILKPIDDLTVEEFRQTMEANLVGPFILLKYFLPAMKEAKKGLIINLPGVLGKIPMATCTAYAASKYGLNGMLKSVREELRRTEIRITNLYLGGTDTPMWDEDIDMRVNRDKFVTADEAARAVWFLCQQPNSGVVSEMVLQPFNHQAI